MILPFCFLAIRARSKPRASGDDPNAEDVIADRPG